MAASASTATRNGSSTRADGRARVPPGALAEEIPASLGNPSIAAAGVPLNPGAG